MRNTVVIIPSRLKARRLPNKPLELINGKEMILHVHDLAKNSRSADVLVVTPDKSIVLVQIFRFLMKLSISETKEVSRNKQNQI